MDKFQLGNTVRDMVTGFTGIAISRVEYLNGCIQYGVKPKGETSEKMPESFYIDEHQLEFVNKGITVPKLETPGAEYMLDSPKI